MLIDLLEQPLAVLFQDLEAEVVMQVEADGQRETDAQNHQRQQTGRREKRFFGLFTPPLRLAVRRVWLFRTLFPWTAGLSPFK